MKLKKILLITFSILSFSASATTLVDSVGVENSAGKKVILHKIEPKETYYALGRKYNVAPKAIMDFNNNIALSIGQIIKIPTDRPFAEQKPVSFNSSSNTSIANNGKRESTHVVQAKETLYSIASKYNMRVDDLMLLNNLKSSALSIGQTLKVLVNDEVSLKPEVVKNTQTGNPEVVREQLTKPETKIKYLDSTDSNSGIEIPRNRYGITEKNEKGIAVWINDENLDATKSYALHKLAPVGTVIKITNPMTNRSVFAKVVGKYTENETTKDVIIVITKAASDALGALDKRFLVNITYGLPNEQ